AARALLGVGQGVAVAPGHADVLPRRAAQRARRHPHGGEGSAGTRALHRAPRAEGERAGLRIPDRGARPPREPGAAVKLVPTAEMTLGPFFPREFAAGANDLTQLEGRTVAGEVIEI